MVYASQDLIQEHDAILYSLEIAGSMAERFREGQPVSRDDLCELVGFLKLFADKCHHGKEERLYFPALQAVGVVRESGPLGELLIEHSRGRRMLVEMEESLGRETAPIDFADAVAIYTVMLKKHIRKENEAIFPLGDSLLPANRQKELIAAFEAFEEEVMGPGTHERLHAMLESFSSRYGKSESEDRLQHV